MLGELARRGTLHHYGRGDLVIVEGASDASLYLLVSGRLKVFTSDGRGRELVYNMLTDGAVFGELGLDGGRRSASVVAVAPSSCVVIPRSELRAFMEANPAFSEFLVLTLIARLRHATRQVRSLALSDVYARVVELMRNEATTEAGARLLPAGMTQREIATRVGATREMVGHILRDLKRGGYLVRHESGRTQLKGNPPKGW